MTNFQRLIFGLAALALFASVFSVLIISKSTLFPFIVGKYVFFRSMISLALFFYLLAILTGWQPKKENFYFLKNPIFLAVGAFVVAFFLAGVFGVDFQNSFWSNFERGEGIFAMFHYFLFMVLALLLLEKEKDWEYLFNASIIAGILVSFYGFAQKLDLPVPGLVNIGIGWYGRMQASLGNPSYVSAYLFFTSFYAIYLLLQEKKVWKKIFYIFSLVVFAAAFIFTETRGAFIGLALAILFGAALFIFKSPVRRVRAYAAYVLIGLSILSSVLFYYRDSEFVKKIPASRVLYLSFSERTAQTRFWTWGSAWQGFLERPIFGWGPENFSWAFDKYFDTRHFIGINTPSESWFDRAHSVFFDYLAETGIVGITAFLSIFVLIFWNLFLRLNFKNYFQHAAALALPVAYLGQGLLLFDVLPIYINLFLFWGFLIYKSSPTNESR